MILDHQPSRHLTYCLNVHPGESWQDNFAAIRTHAEAVRSRLLPPNTPFGLGLRLANLAAETLNHPAPLREFRTFMDAHRLYAFTINGFPYGAFHGGAVKTAVYRPDWSARERLDYTLKLAKILARLLPDGLDGSISTVPLGYKGSPSRAAITAAMVTHLAECAVNLHQIREQTGREIHLGLEPEPDCLLETTDDALHFLGQMLPESGRAHVASRLSCSRQEAESILRRHLGICFDTCHLAIQFESLAGSLRRLAHHGIRISKIQLSSALETSASPEARQRLAEFRDPVYLHQVNTSHAGLRFPDLDEALSSPLESEDSQTVWRTHFHVPLYFEGDAVLHPTSGLLDRAFWNTAAETPVTHLEIETYTFHVLPAPMQAVGIDASIAREYDWVQARFRASAAC